MKPKRLILGTLILAVLFNLGSVCVLGQSYRHSGGWPLPEIGPAFLQDSYYGRSPALESVYGMIGDVPGDTRYTRETRSYGLGCMHPQNGQQAEFTRPSELVQESIGGSLVLRLRLH
ncbi:MAG: hypothetical protein DRO93_05930 [Candidatus Thorarchaeota archaeon]|nr:MAG: hypothetical protein DRO93_05930 [Candidatus Thorarchaeota archaeon]